MAAKKKSSGRKYGKKASDKVAKAMHERKTGKLRSGRSGKKVTSKKQAIAIGLSEARAEGGKVPSPKKKSSGKKRSSAKKKSSSSGGAKKRSSGGRAKKRSTKKRSSKKSSSSS